MQSSQKIQKGQLNGVLSNSVSDYSDATLPLSDTDELLVNQGGTWKKVDKSEIGGGGGGEKSFYTHIGFIGFTVANQWHTNIRPVGNSFLTTFSTTGVLGTSSVPVTTISCSMNLFDSATQITGIDLAYVLNSGSTTLHFYIISQDSNNSNTQVLVDETLATNSNTAAPFIKNFAINAHTALSTNTKIKIFIRNVGGTAEIYDTTIKYTYE